MNNTRLLNNLLLKSRVAEVGNSKNFRKIRKLADYGGDLDSGLNVE
jgi:hypothetical protein